MSQTVVLEQTQTQTQTIAPQSLTLKFNNLSSNENDSKPENPVNNDQTGSNPDQENQSITIKSNDQEPNHATPIPNIPNVDAQTQAAVSEFIRRHAMSTDEDVRAEARNELRGYLEREEIETGTLLVLVNFASGINNAELLDVLCQRVADVIKDKSVEEVREIFNIENDFTPEEEQAIRDEHPWAFED